MFARRPEAKKRRPGRVKNKSKLSGSSGDDGEIEVHVGT